MPKKLGSAIAAAKDRGENKLQNSKGKNKLSEIRDRPHGDTRPLNSEHVQELTDNIAAIGLIQPLAVDAEGHLLAGGHRRAALTLLEKTDPKRFTELFPNSLIPTRTFNFNAADDPEQAIVIEAAENEQRRDYTPAEVRELADRLLAAGYSNTGGRPKKGQKAIVPALMTIVGKSRRTVQRYLEPEEKSVPSDALSKWDKRAAQLERWAEEAGDKSLVRRAAKVAADFRAMEVST